MDTSTETIQTIYKSRNNLVKILQQRGFDVSDYNEFSINDVALMLTNKQLDLLLEDKSGKKIFVKYYLGKSLRPNNIQETVDDLFKFEDILTKNDQLIFISKDDPNDSIKSIITQIWNSDSIYVGLISIKRLQFNILKHSMVPEHTILSPQETQEIFKLYGITDKSKLPEISRFDPVAATIGLQPDQVCKIVRPSKTAIYSNYYRLCYNK